MNSKMLTLALGLPLLSVAAHAQQPSENVRVMGANVPARGFAFVPAGTDLACVAINAGRCWDGKKWHEPIRVGQGNMPYPLLTR
jgi:hypothetical protein